MNFYINLLDGSLSMELEIDLRNLNPHWQNKPGPAVPEFKRWIFPRLLKLLVKGLTPAVVLRGPRRIGKTILIRQIIEQLVNDGVNPRYILYIDFDEIKSLRKLLDPVLSIARWYETKILKYTFNEIARNGSIVYILLDAVQNLDAWAPQVKHLVDNHSVRILVTGSSSLRIEAGRDSLAGRITTVDLGPMYLREIAELRFGYSTKAHWYDNGLDNTYE
jgi:predicted AAA+ superfamily ATPase